LNILDIIGNYPQISQIMQIEEKIGENPGNTCTHRHSPALAPGASVRQVQVSVEESLFAAITDKVYLRVRNKRIPVPRLTGPHAGDDRVRVGES
jgi:hypothetical protein